MIIDFPNALTMSFLKSIPAGNHLLNTLDEWKSKLKVASERIIGWVKHFKTHL